jgi:hypothetical protein
MYGASIDQIFRLAPSPDDALLLIETLRRDKVPKWAKTARVNWAHVSGELNCPDDQEEISHVAE